MTQDLLLAEPKPVHDGGAHAFGRLTRQTVLPVLTGVALLAIWEGSVEFAGLRPAVLPAPSAVLQTMWANRELLIVNAIPTAVETIGGLAPSVVFGGLLGILLSYSTLARDALYPYVILFQLIPKVAVAPLFMLWLGIGWEVPTGDISFHRILSDRHFDGERTECRRRCHSPPVRQLDGN